MSSRPGYKSNRVWSGLKHLEFMGLADHFGCFGLNHEESGDASEEAGAVWLVLGVFERELPRRCRDSIEARYQVSLQTAKDPDGGPCSAYPSGKSWDEVSGKMGSGKKFYHNVTSGADFVVYVAIIIPVIHHCAAAWKLMSIQQP